MSEERGGGWGRGALIAGILLLLVYILCPVVLLLPLIPFYGRDLSRMPPMATNAVKAIITPQIYLHDQIDWYGKMMEYEFALVGIR